MYVYDTYTSERERERTSVIVIIIVILLLKWLFHINETNNKTNNGYNKKSTRDTMENLLYVLRKRCLDKKSISPHAYFYSLLTFTERMTKIMKKSYGPFSAALHLPPKWKWNYKASRQEEENATAAAAAAGAAVAWIKPHWSSKKRSAR